MTRTERERCLSHIQQLVQEKFYEPTFRGKDWKAIVEKHRAAVLNVGSLDEFEATVNGMLKELGSGCCAKPARSAPGMQSRQASEP